MFYDRVFCKYLCPLGAFLAIFNKTGIYKIRREVATCTNCRICDKSCPVNIHVSVQKAVTSGECINCLECVNDCPTKKKSLLPVVLKRDIKPATFAFLGIAIYVVTIGASKVAGIWESSNATLIEISEKGTLNPEDIKGSNTLKEVSGGFQIDIDDLYNELELDPALVPEDTRIKDIKYLIGSDSFEAEEVREAVAEMLSLPAETPASYEQLNEAVVKPGVTKEEKAEPDVNIAEPAASVKDAVTPAFVLEGTMTIKDVAVALKISEESVIDRLGLPAEISRTTPLRDMREQYGYTMPELKQRME
jgi:NAD-dependent dihydropyrimidine dehydrogenase PreA subunit